MTGERPAIAVLSMACRFPDAESPEALWRNVLDGRLSFRPIPPERLALADYRPETVGTADAITPILAGLITDWSFDRARYRVPRSSFAVADLTHWLALETATEAIDRVGGADRLPRERTAVIIGNTLTGEFTRTAQIRLRLPYLLERFEDVLADGGVDADRIPSLLGGLGERLRADFPDPDEESLAGGLANTIAGRIANHFDFHGGAWTVDGACASSLLAVNDACTRLVEGSIDVAVVGGVDLSLDPFELVGFSRNGALARDQMRVFDRRSAGFWPGEGCGVIVLARGDIAGALDLAPDAVIAGWGVSTDGAGGLTRPTEAGQIAALRRAYARAGIDPAGLGYIEAHGTGTSIGDPTEVRALAEFVGPGVRPVTIGSIKANIGHTKAAAGLAGMIKTVSAVRDGIVPPHVGCETPHEVFAETGHRLAPALGGDWPHRGARIAGVSGFGFGGVNAHVVITDAGSRPRVAAARPIAAQDAELFLFGAPDRETLVAEMEMMRTSADALSLSELADAAAHAAERCVKGAIHRAAVVATRPDTFAEQLKTAIGAAKAGATWHDPGQDVGVAEARGAARIGFLFPGQAAPARIDGGIWRRRFADSRTALDQLPTATHHDTVATEIAQPGIVAASCAALSVLQRMGVTGTVAVGHSLGELTALHWAGAMSAEEAIALAAMRGAVMAENAVPGGAMARAGLDRDAVEQVAARLGLTVACENGADETVVAGPSDAIDRFVDAVQGSGGEASRLAVSHAFHTSDMAPAAAMFADRLGGVALGHPIGRVISTVSGGEIAANDDIRALLTRQLVAPVRFTDALEMAARDCDVFIEIGAGAGLARLARLAGHHAVSIDAHGSSLRGLLDGLALAWLSGARLDIGPLFADRTVRPFDPARRPVFLANPCGRARRDQERRQEGARADAVAIEASATVTSLSPALALNGHGASGADGVAADDAPVLQTVLRQVADELALPEAAITPELRFLDDLHLNSIGVGRIVSRVAARIGVAQPAALTDFANASLAELAEAIGELRHLGPEHRQDQVTGVDAWIRPYTFSWVADSDGAKGREIAWRATKAGSDFPPPDDLTERLENRGPPGALIWLGPGFAKTDIARLWSAAQDAAASPETRYLCVVHHGAPVGAFARTLLLEDLFEGVLVLSLPTDGAAFDNVAEAIGRAGSGYSELRLSAEGQILKSVFAPAGVGEDRQPVLSASDVILATGGARGIGAECAIRLAQATRAALLLVGRSEESHPEIADTLACCGALGLRARYSRCDVTDFDQVARTVGDAQSELGTITAILHAAGVNRPGKFLDLGETDLVETIAPKTEALKHCLAAVDTERLRQVVTFGSIIGRLGLAGEAHYALANDALAALTDQLAADIPHARVHCVEWSIWAGAGMGERLGTLERLSAEGVKPLALDQALDAFEDLVIGGKLNAPVAVVTSRFGPPDAVDLNVPDLPFRRFLETPRVHYPEVEFVADCKISLGTDPYLADHRIDDMAVLPAVFALEAVAQAASALVPDLHPTCFENVDFHKAIVVPKGGSVTVRIAILHRGDRIEAILRASDDDFADMRVRAHLLLGSQARLGTATGEEWSMPPLEEAIDARPLYETLFFQRGRFRNVASFRNLSARRMVAELATPELGSKTDENWFGQYMHGALMLGDPGIRDSCLHALQAMVPHKRVIPVSVARIVLHPCQSPYATIEAVERWSDGDCFIFDIVVRDAQGQIVETWHNAKFQAIADLETHDMHPSLVATWLERCLGDVLERPDLRIALVTGARRAERRRAALARLDMSDTVARGDGKPLVANGGHAGQGVSLAHSQDTTMMVVAPNDVTCDIEYLADETAESVVPMLATADRRLAGRIAEAAGEALASAALRLWCARECLRKSGCSPETSLELWDTREDGAVLLRAGDGYVGTVRAGDRILAVMSPASELAGSPRPTVPDPQWEVIR